MKKTQAAELQVMEAIVKGAKVKLTARGQQLLDQYGKKKGEKVHV